MTEHTLVRALIQVLRGHFEPEGLVFKHGDRTAGLPDISVTWSGLTSWWEVKHAKPKIVGTGLQHLTARRLAKAGLCFYIVYLERGGAHRTCIVDPKEIQPDGTFLARHEVFSIDHYWVASMIEQIVSEAG